MHACGQGRSRDVSGRAARILAGRPEVWSGTLVAQFQPEAETGDGARAMLDDHLAAIIPAVDVALAQHVLALPAGQLGTRAGPILSAADSMRVTVHGRDAHGSMPQAAVDPVGVRNDRGRLQTGVAREVPPTDGRAHRRRHPAATKSNVILDSSQLQLNPRTHRHATHSTMLDATRQM